MIFIDRDLDNTERSKNAHTPDISLKSVITIDDMPFSESSNGSHNILVIERRCLLLKNIHNHIR